MHSVPPQKSTLRRGLNGAVFTLMLGTMFPEEVLKVWVYNYGQQNASKWDLKAKTNDQTPLERKLRDSI